MSTRLHQRHSLDSEGGGDVSDRVHPSFRAQQGATRSPCDHIQPLGDDVILERTKAAGMGKGLERSPRS